MNFGTPLQKRFDINIHGEYSGRRDATDLGELLDMLWRNVLSDASQGIGDSGSEDTEINSTHKRLMDNPIVYIKIYKKNSQDTKISIMAH